jgi:hypothetical protein
MVCLPIYKLDLANKLYTVLSIGFWSANVKIKQILKIILFLFGLY